MARTVVSWATSRGPVAVGGGSWRTSTRGLSPPPAAASVASPPDQPSQSGPRGRDFLRHLVHLAGPPAEVCWLFQCRNHGYPCAFWAVEPAVVSDPGYQEAKKVVSKAVQFCTLSSRSCSVRVLQQTDRHAHAGLNHPRLTYRGCKTPCCVHRPAQAACQSGKPRGVLPRRAAREKGARSVGPAPARRPKRPTPIFHSVNVKLSFANFRLLSRPQHPS